MFFYAVEGQVYHASCANVNELTLLSTCAQPNLGKACEDALAMSVRAFSLGKE